MEKGTIYPVLKTTDSKYEFLKEVLLLSISRLKFWLRVIVRKNFCNCTLMLHISIQPFKYPVRQLYVYQSFGQHLLRRNAYYVVVYATFLQMITFTQIFNSFLCQICRQVFSSVFYISSEQGLELAEIAHYYLHTDTKSIISFKN